MTDKDQKHPGGRPPHFTSPDELERLVDSYFSDEAAAKRQDKGEQVTLTGLALHLGFADKCSLYDYQKKPEFSHSIKKARTMVEHSYENSLRSHGRTGDIFALKNFGWSDKQEHEVSGKDGGPISVIERKIVKAND